VLVIPSHTNEIFPSLIMHAVKKMRPCRAGEGTDACGHVDVFLYPCLTEADIKNVSCRWRCPKSANVEEGTGRWPPLLVNS
jgi:hypothetical protein